MRQWGRVGRMGQIICPIKSTGCQGQAGVRYGKTAVLGEDTDIQFRVEPVVAAAFGERRTAEKSRERASKLIRTALLEGSFVFNSRPTGVTESGQTVDACARSMLATAAAEVFLHLRLVPIRPTTELAYKFLGV